MVFSTEYQIGDSVYIKELDMMCNIDGELGSGTQGKVYSLICPDNSNLVLKWYFPNMATTIQYDILKTLTSTKTPSDGFLWPIGLVENPNKKGYGYIMPRKDDRFKSFSLWLSRKINPTFKVLITACFEICRNFHILHSKGLCYQDLSLNNLYFDPISGEIKIGDTDNIIINGSEQGNVLGTPKFMAPEIITCDSLPNTQTDLYSLAVLLFYILFLNHPLEGKKETAIKSLDLPAMEQLYGLNPIFIFDPEDTSNSPHPTYHQNALIYWDIYPKYLKDLFVRAFTKGIQDPINGRVRETEWQNALSALRDSIFYCNDCGSENFLDIDVLNQKYLVNHIAIDNQGDAGYSSSNSIIRSNYEHAVSCWNSRCNNSCSKILRLQIDDRLLVVLNHDTKLYSHHIDPNNRYEFTFPIAKVTKHPTNPRLWGLKNLTENVWNITKPNSESIVVYPNQNLLLLDRIVINFGKSLGKIYY